MAKFVNKYLVLIIGSVILLFVIFSFIAPLAAHLGWDWLARPIYFIYKFLCHQRPWRSIHLFDHQTAFCTRDVFIYLGMGGAALAVHYFKLRPLKWYLAGLAVLPIAADGITQTIAEVVSISSNNPEFFYASTNYLRATTGALFGLGMGLLIFGILNETLRDEEGIKLPMHDWKKPVYVLISGFIGLQMFYVGLVQIWFATSDHYRPELPLDHRRLFPGVNYEVTTGGSHGCPYEGCLLEYEVGE